MLVHPLGELNNLRWVTESHRPWFFKSLGTSNSPSMRLLGRALARKWGVEGLLSEPKGQGGFRAEDQLVFPLPPPPTPSPPFPHCSSVSSLWQTDREANHIKLGRCWGVGAHEVPGAGGVCQACTCTKSASSCWPTPSPLHAFPAPECLDGKVEAAGQSAGEHGSCAQI